MHRELRDEIAQWLQSYSRPLPPRPPRTSARQEWERELRRRQDQLIQEVLAMAQVEVSGLDCVQSFEKALEGARDPSPNLDVIASLLWMALGEPTQVDIFQSETRMTTAERVSSIPNALGSD